jgi:hypothetical protein
MRIEQPTLLPGLFLVAGILLTLLPGPATVAGSTRGAATLAPRATLIAVSKPGLGAPRAAVTDTPLAKFHPPR